MDASRKRLTPDEIIAADDPTQTPTPRAKALWADAKIRSATIASLADSTYALARLWQSAWVVGKGDALPATKLKALDETTLQNVYRSLTFAPAQTLDQLAATGLYEPRGGAGGGAAPRKPRAAGRSPAKPRGTRTPRR